MIKLMRNEIYCTGVSGAAFFFLLRRFFFTTSPSGVIAVSPAGLTGTGDAFFFGDGDDCLRCPGVPSFLPPAGTTRLGRAVRT
jgi:hypothetical protein